MGSVREQLQDGEVTIGSILCGERHTMGKSLEDVYQELRVRPELIEAIEANKVDAVDRPEILTGHIRSYARYLGLDPAEVVEVYRETCGLESKKDLISSKKPREKANPMSGAEKAGLGSTGMKLTEKSPNFGERLADIFEGAKLVLPFALMIGAIAGLIYGGAQVLQRFQKLDVVPVEARPVVSTENAMSTDVSNISESTAEPEGISVAEIDYEGLYQRQALEAPVVTPRLGRIADLVNNTGENSANVVNIEDGLQQLAQNQEPIVSVGPTIPEIELLPADESWVLVTNQDGEEIFQGLLQAGQGYSVPMDEGLVVLRRAGNATQLFVRVNDQIFGPVSADGASVINNVALDPAALNELYDIVDEDQLQRISQVEDSYLARLEPNDTQSQ